VLGKKAAADLSLAAAATVMEVAEAALSVVEVGWAALSVVEVGWAAEADWAGTRCAVHSRCNRSPACTH
jgi:hypothetical protein